MTCGRYPCGAYSGGCMFADCVAGKQYIAAPASTISYTLAPPRFLPVNMQIPSIGFTIAVIDSSGNVVIKTEQSESPFAPKQGDQT